jgi:hypothetical protein
MSFTLLPRKHAAWTSLAAAAIIAVAFNAYQRDDQPASSLPASALASTPSAVTNSLQAIDGSLPATPEPADVPDIFAVRTWEPPKPPPAKPLPPPPPQAPPLPFRFVGRIDDPDRKPAFLLSAGNRVLSVTVGEEVDDIYRIEKYANGQLTFRYRPLDITQTLSVGTGP